MQRVLRATAAGVQICPRMFRTVTARREPQVDASVSKPAFKASSHIENLVDEIAKMNLLEVRDFVKVLKQRLDIPDIAAMPAMMAAPMPGGGAAPAAEEPKEEKTSFDLKLTGFDAKSKIKVIKEIRALTELGLKEAKDLVEKAPCVVKQNISKADAEAIAEKLKAVGAEVAIE